MSAPAVAVEERLHEQFEDMENQRTSYTSGMWVFLASEIMFFGVLLLCYTIFRVTFPDAFRAVGQEPNQAMGTLNTVVLLTSSLTMALAVRSAKLREGRKLVWLLVATAMLGAVFMTVKLSEWATDAHHHHLMGAAFRWDKPGATPRQAELFFFLYFAVTGVHALHLSLGIVAVLVLAFLYRIRHRSVVNSGSPAELVGLYWHFVDLVWVFLYPMFYLLPPPR